MTYWSRISLIRRGLALLLLDLREGDQRILADEDLVDQSVGLRLLRAHEAIAVHVALDLLDVLTGMARDDLHELVDEGLELLHLDEHVGCVTAESAGALMDHDPRIRQRIALALRASREEHRAHRRSLSDADGAHRRLEVLHGVVDREARGHDATRRVDVQVDVALRIL